MKKSCPACGEPITDPSKQFCPKCDKLPQLLTSGFSKEELEHLSQVVSNQLKKDWKFKAQIVAISILLVLSVVLTVIGVIDAIVGFNLRDSMTTHFRDFETQATNMINISMASFGEGRFSPTRF